jgi:signal transduction histidine kinase
VATHARRDHGARRGRDHRLRRDRPARRADLRDHVRRGVQPRRPARHPDLAALDRGGHGRARRVADRDPDEVREALRAIRQVSRESLAELGALLGVLREGEDAPAERTPAPDLDALPRLVDGLREAGLEVDLQVDGNGAAVPEVVAAAGYRIVQEALTNVARHAGPNVRAHVRLTRRDGVVEVEVRDDGRDAPATVRPGGGLTGMRERAASLGGTFEAGRAAEGGFRVWASLPVVVAR